MVAWYEDFTDALDAAAQLTPAARRASGAQEAVREALAARVELLQAKAAGDDERAAAIVAEDRTKAEFQSVTSVLEALAWWSPEERAEIFDTAREAAQAAWTARADLQFLRAVAVRWPEILDEAWLEEAAAEIDNDLVPGGANPTWTQRVKGTQMLGFLRTWLAAQDVECPDFDMSGLLANSSGQIRSAAVLLYERLPVAAQQLHAPALRKVFLEDLASFPYAWRLVVQRLGPDVAAEVCTADEAIERACAVLKGEDDDDPESDEYWDRKRSRQDSLRSIFDTYSTLDPDTFGDAPALVDAVADYFGYEHSKPLPELYDALAWCVGASAGKPSKQPWVDILVSELGSEARNLPFVRYATEALASGCDIDGGEVDLAAIRKTALACTDAERARYFGRFLPRAFTADAKAFSKMLVKSDSLPAQVCALEALLVLPPADFMRLVPKRLPTLPESWKALTHRVSERAATQGAVEDITWKGISMQLFIELTYEPAYYHGMTTAQMLPAVVKPLSLGHGSAADAPYSRDKIPVGDFGVNENEFGAVRPLVSAYATEFVSHSWNYTVAMVLDMLKFGSNADRDAYYWFDLLVIDQHEAPSHPASWYDTTFSNCVGSFGHLSLTLDHWAQPTTLSRIWCIWEIYSSLNFAGQVELCFPWREETNGAIALLSTADQITALLEEIDVATAEATFAEDKVRILEAINTSGTSSVSDVNHRLRSFFASYLLGYAAYYGPSEIVDAVLRYEPRLDLAQNLSTRKFTVPIKLPAVAAISWGTEEVFDKLIDPEKVPLELRMHFIDRVLRDYFKAANEDHAESARLLSILQFVVAHKEVPFTEAWLDEYLESRPYLTTTQETLEPLRALTIPASLLAAVAAPAAPRKSLWKSPASRSSSGVKPSCVLQ